MNDLKPVNGDVEQLEAELARVLKQGAAHADSFAEYERLAMEHKRMHRECHNDAMKIQGQIGRAKHLLEGKCAAFIHGGDAWHPTETPCKNKAKPDSQFCGVHKRG